MGLRTSLKQAEELKLHYGSTLDGLTDKNEIIEVPLSGGTQPRKVSRQFLCQIIQSRVEEIFKLVHREILRTGYRELMAPGVVLTGGTSLLNGIDALGEQILDLPIRVGYPNTVGGLSEIVKSPLYATAVGLILYGRKHASNGTQTQGYKNIFTRITQSTKNWLAEVI